MCVQWNKKLPNFLTQIQLFPYHNHQLISFKHHHIIKEDPGDQCPNPVLSDRQKIPFLQVQSSRLKESFREQYSFFPSQYQLQVTYGTNYKNKN